MSWLLWPLIILLMNALGGLAALGALFNLNSEQAGLASNVPRNSPVVAGQKMTKRYPFLQRNANCRLISQESESIVCA